MAVSKRVVVFGVKVGDTRHLSGRVSAGDEAKVLHPDDFVTNP